MPIENPLFQTNNLFPGFSIKESNIPPSDDYGEELTPDELALMFKKMNAGLSSFDLKDFQKKDESFNNFNIYGLGIK